VTARRALGKAMRDPGKVQRVLGKMLTRMVAKRASKAAAC
jgi:hypothetical protein